MSDNLELFSKIQAESKRNFSKTSKIFMYTAIFINAILLSFMVPLGILHYNTAILILMILMGATWLIVVPVIYREEIYKYSDKYLGSKHCTMTEFTRIQREKKKQANP